MTQEEAKKLNEAAHAEEKVVIHWINPVLAKYQNRELKTDVNETNRCKIAVFLLDS